MYVGILQVEEGTKIGTVTNHFGQRLFELEAPKSGTVILLRHVARVESGDFLLVVV